MSQKTNVSAGEKQLVTFKLGEEEYGIEILLVQEIIRITEITRVPKVPAHIVGIINLRGVVIPVVDMRTRFQLSAARHTHASRIIVVTVGRLIVGLIVDQVMEVLRLAADRISDGPDILKKDHSAACISGIGRLDERLIILLDLEELLSGHDFEALSNTQDVKVA